jgi:hypothetical protein
VAALERSRSQSLSRHEGAEVTIASRSLEKLIQTQLELEPVHTVVVDITDEGAEETIVAALSRIDQGLICAGIMLNGAIMYNGPSSPWLIPIVSSSSTVYTVSRTHFFFMHEGHGQASGADLRAHGCCQMEVATMTSTTTPTAMMCHGACPTHHGDLPATGRQETRRRRWCAMIAHGS